MRNNTLQRLKYLTADSFAAGIAWVLLFAYRKLYIEPEKFGEVPLEFDQQFYIGLAVVPLFWITLYTITGTYRQPYRKSRLKELGQTLFQSLVGVILIFFTLLLDDQIASYKSYYQTFLALYFLHFSFTFSFRFALSSRTAYRIHNRLIGFNTVLIGSNEKALQLFQELEGLRRSTGQKFVGFLHLNGNHDHLLNDHLPHLGSVKSIREVIEEQKIEEVIIAIESSEHEDIGKIINTLQGEPVHVQVIPDMYDILSGQVKMTSIFGAPLIEITPQIIPIWQVTVKRALDIITSILVLVFFSWLYVVVGSIVVLTSKGPALYTHQRIGRYGKPFKIIKFRSMFLNAEAGGPALSKSNDSRITPFGKFMRKTRLDELPQFWNVLKGDMSMVGPRPERQFFIDQIVKKAPHYQYLHKVRPGITSWGQVKFGYAENVDEMVQRLKYDILYIENMSLFVDFKILIYTVLIVLQGRGK